VAHKTEICFEIFFYLDQQTVGSNDQKGGKNWTKELNFKKNNSCFFIPEIDHRYVCLANFISKNFWCKKVARVNKNIYQFHYKIALEQMLALFVVLCKYQSCFLLSSRCQELASYY
jgi:hypothetical protein